MAFLNQDLRCFARYPVVACEISCMAASGYAKIYYVGEDEIKRHDTGFSVELKDGFECSLRITKDGLIFSMGKCPDFSGRIQDVIVYPSIGIDEIMFVHQEVNIAIILRMEIEKKDMEK